MKEEMECEAKDDTPTLLQERIQEAGEVVSMLNSLRNLTTDKMDRIFGEEHPECKDYDPVPESDSDIDKLRYSFTKMREFVVSISKDISRL